MDNDNIIFVVVGIVIISIITIPTLYFNSKNAKIVEMVKAGANPLDAACALEGDRSGQTNCTHLFVSRGYIQ